ncbi:hypothetical protein [Nitrospirillum viridazoti]|uniref:Uncharacterized protein n=1 Tax=Nitrospirillum viridazoti CBAmc TaxID=1441467 RepID=A0A248JWJ1_9PROT|nr:hypothetical protein [Nitrospirillum amazonense]ASG22488.1 hypothetical protein Y958_16255 [Nitrospirillum amazonense CBAmc]TWB42959.1 hypothetical protein FBZ91_102175 [Nitrospirillum amazonense]
MDGWQRRYRLNNGPGGLGVSCTAEGLALAGVPLLAKGAGGFQARPAAEVAVLLTRAYAGAEPNAAILPGLTKIADALNRGDLAQAMIRAVHLRLPELDWDAAVRLARANDNLAKYSPDQARDDHGRWTDEGGASPEPVKVKQMGAGGAPNKSSILPEDKNSQNTRKVCGQYPIYENRILSQADAKKMFDEELGNMLRAGLISKQDFDRFSFVPWFAATTRKMNDPLLSGSMRAALSQANGLTGGFVAGGLTDPRTNTSKIYMSAAAGAVIPGLGKTDARRTMQYVLRHELFHQQHGGTCAGDEECCADAFAIANMPEK